jgi:hypothetical protein
MHSPLKPAALLCLTLLLGACDPRPDPLPAPKVEAVQKGVDPSQASGVATGGTGDTSVPKASSVVDAASNAPGADTSAGRSTTAMTPTQESTAMPMAGQNNDHSAPAVPARRASAP